MAHERINLAGDLGCPHLRAFGGWIGKEVQRDHGIDLVTRDFNHREILRLLKTSGYDGYLSGE